MPLQQLEKRRRIMKRSIALGHCVCDPQRPCPCDLFRERNICECAGERPPAMTGEVRLTEHVRSAGCASKIGKKDLLEVLSGLPDIDDERVIVGRSAGDDAGVIMLSKDAATVLTVDVFSPSVDDPYTFGQIAAANSVSDIYAMGGTPESALSIIGFPIRTLPPRTMHEILRGGIDKMKEAGASVIGGHSINDEEVKCGFAVIGTAARDRFVQNSGAKPGDAVVLTKPIGAGIVTFAHQVGRAPDGALDEVAASMSSLNKLAAQLMFEHGVHAATDVTGFSLLGHMAEIVRNSAVAVEIDFDSIPLFHGVSDLARQEVLPGAVERNREAVEEALLDLSALAPAQQSILFCPETSGGLLVFLPEKKARAYVEALHAGRITEAAVIGRAIAERQGGRIRAVTNRAADFSPIAPVPARRGRRSAEPAPAGVDASCCCPPGSAGAVAESQAGGPPAAGRQIAAAALSASEAFKAYMAAVNAPGALDSKQKKLISLALSVLSRCEPCVKINAEAALKAGATEDEVAEAVALGISFGGAPVAMFYNTLKR